MYYALTEKGHDRIEQGLPEHKSDYFSVLGAIADLEETEPLKPHTLRRILGVMEVPIGYIAFYRITLESLIKNDLVEEVCKGDERFPDFK